MNADMLSLVLLLIQVSSCIGTSQYGLCSQVYLMNQYCSNHDVPIVDDVTSGGDRAVEHRVGKAGPRGPPGEKGLPGLVNYAEVEGKMGRKIEEVEDKFNLKLVEYENLLSRTAKLEESLSQLERRFNLISIHGCDDVRVDTDGVFEILVLNSRYQVYCDMTTDNGKWTVFQRRMDGSVDFNRNWDDYVQGFGNLTGELWLGLEKIHRIIKDDAYELRIDMTDSNDNVYYVKYGTFAIAGRSENFKLNVGDFSGNTKDVLAYHNNMPFSTKNNDNDKWSLNCAGHLLGGWWFKSCMHSNLNGDFEGDGNEKAGSSGIHWGLSMKKTEMKFRKKAL